MSVPQSVRPHGTNRHPLATRYTDFHAFYIQGFLLKYSEEIQIYLKSNKNNRRFTQRRTYIYKYLGCSVTWLPSRVIDNATIDCKG
jgi:hypothetical protein